MNESIIYEQPLNEIIRVALRLENLFRQIDYQLQSHSTYNTRNLISLLINLLQLLERPDLKAKLAKELREQILYLERVGKHLELMQQLDELSRILIDSSGKIGQRLRDMELINTLRLHLNTPGSGCSFDYPLYHYWLAQDFNTRQELITNWLQEFQQIRKTADLMLGLIRKNARSEQKQAMQGFYQELLNPAQPLRLLQISLEKQIAAYPEVSIGRHFLSVRFYSPDIYKRPSQYKEHVTFTINYCQL